ncbi:MAG: D-aminoacylase [Planctomycetales bacterium]|nr:D-aminoacylase [Planctomycetales bacterium]
MLRTSALTGRLVQRAVAAVVICVLGCLGCLGDLAGIGQLAPAHAQEAAADSEPYDVLIVNGRIVDGSGNPWFHGELAIRGDRIVRVARSIAGAAKHKLDANGMVVAPGFIDVHSHSDFLLLEDGAAQSKIRQGVTTEVLGEGSSPGPFGGKLGPRTVTVQGEPRKLQTLPDYFQAVEQAGIATNVATYVGLNNVWQHVMGESFDRPSADQLAEMGRLVDEAMQAGALGLSSQVMMPPGSLATTEEIIALCKVVRRSHGIYSTHIRNEGGGVFESVKEAIEIGRQSGVSVDVIHLKIADERLWGRMDEVVKLIQDAREEGLNVQANVYPYTRGNNNLASIIPPWAHEGGTQQLLARLRDPEQRKRLKRDIASGDIAGWYNHYTAVGSDWSRILVSGDNRFKGLTMDRVMALRTEGKRRTAEELLDELFDYLIEEGGSVSAVYAHHTEDDMMLALRQPWCSVGSDGSAYAIEGPLRRGNPHPRNFGAFPRVLGKYVRERPLLQLEDAVRKMTSLNAAKAGLRGRGTLREGAYADVVVFDPAAVADRATYTQPFQYPVGIKHVLVNGELVLADGEHTGKRPGRALRRD